MFAGDTTGLSQGYLPEAQLHQLFPSPILIHHWPDSEALNDGLKQAISRERARDPGRVRTNRGGWHSHLTLQDWDDVHVQQLMTMVRTLVAEMTLRLFPDADSRQFQDWEIRAWANVNLRDAYNVSHHHGGNLWSGVYYVDGGTESSDGSPHGRTMFEDRTGVPVAGPDPFARELAITPKPGMMILFPALLYHRVEPFRGEGERITIAFNLRHPDFRVPEYTREINWRWHYFLGPMLVVEKIQRWATSLIGR